MTLEELETRLLARANASPDESYTAKLVAAGPSRSAKKLGEEAVEAVIAAGDRRQGRNWSRKAPMCFITSSWC